MRAFSESDRKSIQPFQALPTIECDSFFVMAGLDPAIHVFLALNLAKTWMPGTSPGMTRFVASVIPLAAFPVSLRMRPMAWHRLPKPASRIGLLYKPFPHWSQPHMTAIRGAA